MVWRHIKTEKGKLVCGPKITHKVKWKNQWWEKKEILDASPSDVWRIKQGSSRKKLQVQKIHVHLCFFGYVIVCFFPLLSTKSRWGGLLLLHSSMFLDFTWCSQRCPDPLASWHCWDPHWWQTWKLMFAPLLPKPCHINPPVTCMATVQQCSWCNTSENQNWSPARNGSTACVLY